MTPDLPAIHARRDMALRCHNALIQATALGAKIGIHSAMVQVWSEQANVALDVARDAEKQLRGAAQ